MPSLSDFNKGRIVAYRDMGLSFTEIARRIESRKSTVASYFLRYTANQNAQPNILQRRGRHRVSDNALDQMILTECETNRLLPAAQIRQRVANRLQRQGIVIPSIETVRRRLREQGLKARRPATKDKLTEVQQLARFLFSERYYNWDREWSRVVFTDECTFVLGSSGVQYVRRRIGERYDARCVRQRMNKSVARLNVWGAISANGISDLYIISGRLTAEEYRDNILAEAFLNFCNVAYPQNNFILQQDNCPVHTAGIVATWLREQNVAVLEWPAISPDLNCIENVWGDMKRQLALKTSIHTIAQLRREVQQMWQQYREDRRYVIDNCIRSMPRRCHALEANRGLFLKY
jgi:transposase